MKTILSLLVAMVLLPGCAVYTPSGAVVVGEPGGHGHVAPAGGHGGGRFCPPGQAKKGNC